VFIEKLQVQVEAMLEQSDNMAGSILSGTLGAVAGMRGEAARQVICWRP
jgi:hypothetical protein